MKLFDPLPGPPPPATAQDPGRLSDGFGRRFSYLRLSLTERCNFRCTYCLPNGFAKQAGAPPELSRSEIRRAVDAFAGLGLWKLRLTGGEPTVRSDFTQIASELSQIEGIRHLAMTTNGYRLDRQAGEWREAGIGSINVSVDSLDRDQFAKLTGRDLLPQVLAGIDTALGCNFDAVKINAVLMREPGTREWEAILAYIAEREITWRFIEFMRTNDNADLHRSHTTPGELLRNRLVSAGWRAQPRSDGSGPSIDFAHPDYRGKIGLIAPYSPGFCESCNRLRLSSRGKLHLCLFGEAGLDLRPLLQHDEQRDELLARIKSAMPAKARGHRLHQNDSGGTANFAAIGG